MMAYKREVNKKDNIFYKHGFEIGLKYGAVREIEELLSIDNEELYKLNKEELLNVIMNPYITFEIKIPSELFNIEEITMKKLNFYLLGYVEGKQRNARNKADKKYHKKIGLISKSYKIHENVANDFLKVCKERDVSMGSTLERLMKSFIDES